MGVVRMTEQAAKETDNPVYCRVRSFSEGRVTLWGVFCKGEQGCGGRVGRAPSKARAMTLAEAHVELHEAGAVPPGGFNKNVLHMVDNFNSAPAPEEVASATIVSTEDDRLSYPSSDKAFEELVTTHTKNELYGRAEELGIRGRSKMTKDQLAYAIVEAGGL